MEEEIRQLNSELEQRVARRTAQLRELAVKLIRAEEEERRRVAEVLHEGLQQILVGASYGLQSLIGLLKQPELREGHSSAVLIVSEPVIPPFVSSPGR